MSSKSNSKPKSILITGGASGIGLAITRYFAGEPEGHSIAILDVNAATGEAVAAALAAEFPRRTIISFHACDVSSWDEQARVFERVYREHGNALDVVVANAGVSEQGATTLVKLQSESGAGSGERGEEGPRKPSVKTVEVNLLGVVYCMFIPPAAYFIQLIPSLVNRAGIVRIREQQLTWMASGQPGGALHG
jgi:NAD(P)-dependent dehydrogenase (short-subunit alcohol dehydrogenase family)